MKIIDGDADDRKAAVRPGVDPRQHRLGLESGRRLDVAFYQLVLATPAQPRDDA